MDKDMLIMYFFAGVVRAQGRGEHEAKRNN
jgi:hypothetical protein